MPAPTDVQLSAPIVRVAICAFLDLLDDPLRYCIAPHSLTMPATTLLDEADPYFDGQTFTALDPRFIDMSPIQQGAGGTQRVDFTVSGDIDLDSETMNALSNPARFRGRLARVWTVLLDAAGQPIAADHEYSGYMSVPSYGLSPEARSITVASENYLVLRAGGAPARTLLSAKKYDPGDLSAEATLSTAGGTGALGLPGGGRIDPINPNEQYR